MGAAVEEANRSLFVGNLDPRVTEEIIFELFLQAGPVVKVKIPKDGNGNPRHYAFVNFKHEVSAPYALNLLNGIRLYGRPMNIQFRSGSSHVPQDDVPMWCPQGADSAAPYPPFFNNRNSKPMKGMIAPGFRRFQQAMLAGNSQRQPAVVPFKSGFGCGDMLMESSTGSGQNNPAPCLHPRALIRLSALQSWYRLMNRTTRQQPASSSKPEQPAHQHPPPPAFHPPAASPRRLELRKGRQGAHPYLPDGRRFGERDHGRGQHGDEYGGHEQWGWETPPYEDWHREGWSNDYEGGWESFRDDDWYPAGY